LFRSEIIGYVSFPLWYLRRVIDPDRLRFIDLKTTVGMACPLMSISSSNSLSGVSAALESAEN
jgi:hypothetical protein